MPAEHKPWFVARFLLSLLWIFLHRVESDLVKSRVWLKGGYDGSHVIRLATRNAIHMSSRNDHRRRDRSWERSDRDWDRDRYRDKDRGGDRDRGRGDRYRDSRRRSRSRSPRRGDHDRRPGAHNSFSFWVASLLETEGDRRNHRYDDRRDSDRRDRDDRRRDDRRDDRDRHRDDPRDRDVPKNLEVGPSPGLKEESCKHWSFTTSQDIDSIPSPFDSRTTRTERRSRE